MHAMKIKAAYLISEVSLLPFLFTVLTSPSTASSKFTTAHTKPSHVFKISQVNATKVFFSSSNHKYQSDSCSRD